MTESREVELCPCDYSAKCLAPWCRLRATTILRYLDAQGHLSSDGRVRDPRARAVRRDESNQP